MFIIAIYIYDKSYLEVYINLYISVKLLLLSEPPLSQKDCKHLSEIYSYNYKYSHSYKTKSELVKSRVIYIYRLAGFGVYTL